jgi:arabinose-5-phosphate isomerase
MSFIEFAKEVFDIESKAISGLSNLLDDNFTDSVECILGCEGRVIVCGMGKSGIIGKKIVATFASTGTPSFFMHPGEAYHGDLGMVTRDDVFLALSNSGETEEVVKLLPFLKENQNTVISMTGNVNSTLARASHFHLNIKVHTEACPLQLAPTASTTATLAMGDALAVTLMRVRKFQPENFAKFHPGGSLGRRLLHRVEDEMQCDSLPFVSKDAGVLDLIRAMTSSGLGLCLIDDQERGVITDGDIRRAIETYGETLFSMRAEEIMCRQPITVEVGTRMEDALSLMESRKITSLLVTDGTSIVGVVKK